MWVKMINSVGEYVAGERYNLKAEEADRFIIIGYADGELDREITDEEREQAPRQPPGGELLASAHYNLALQEFWKGTNGDVTSAGVVVKCRLMRVSAYTFSQAHQFASSLPAAIVTDATLGTKTANGAGCEPGLPRRRRRHLPARPCGGGDRLPRRLHRHRHPGAPPSSSSTSTASP